MSSKTEKLEIIKGSGNIYQDFGDPDANLKYVKAKLAAEIIRVMDKDNITPAKAHTLTGIDKTDFSRIRNAHLCRISCDKLVRILGGLDRKVEPKVSVIRRARLSSSSVLNSKSKQLHKLNQAT